MRRGRTFSYESGEARPHAQRILVVDTSPDMRRSSALFLAGDGHEVIYRHGTRSLVCFERQSFDLIFGNLHDPALKARTSLSVYSIT